MQLPTCFSVLLSLIFKYRISVLLCAIASVLETIHHVSQYRITRPAAPLDAPFFTGCQKRSFWPRRENATILMLARNSDVDGAVESLTSFEAQFNHHYHYPITFLNDQPWNKTFVKAVRKVVSGQARFGVIDQSMWGYPDWIDQTKARKCMDAQASADIVYGGNESYHHMCRFYSG